MLQGITIGFSQAAASRSFKRPCSDIWELITDTWSWPQWGPSVKAVKCNVRFIRQGTGGKVRTAAGIWLPFTINRYEEGHFWSWTVAGIPATGHRVKPQEDGLCQLTFEVPIIAAPYAYICRIALERIGNALDKRRKI